MFFENVNAHKSKLFRGVFKLFSKYNRIKVCGL